MSDAELVSGLRDRNPAAFQQICEIHLQSVWRYVCACVGGNLHLAEDIVSETMSALMESAEKLNPDECNLGGWLRAVAANKVRDHLRAAARVKHLIDEARNNGQTAISVEQPSEELERAERAEQVRQIVNGMTDQHRLSLEWKYIERLSVREIAVRLATTEKGAESILFRARNEFRKRYEQENREPTAPRSSPPESAKKSCLGSSLTSPSRADTEQQGVHS